MNGKEKLRMAQELASRNSSNILVHNKTVKISDIGLPKNQSKILGLANEIKDQPAYIDPQCFKNEQFIRNKKSDIYALGVLLWELT
ncbi:hypothetical protein G9A89_011989, partial [Geosiphon pyriformis]